MSQEHELTTDGAGAGFAAAVVLASRFRGQEISSRQALLAAGIGLLHEKPVMQEKELDADRSGRPWSSVAGCAERSRSKPRDGLNAPPSSGIGCFATSRRTPVCLSSGGLRP
jgi:hypothetical protein